MLTQDDLERERYEARRKAQLELNTNLKSARMEGVAAGRVLGLQEGRVFGRKEGEKIGTIHLCERFLGRVETPVERLASLPLAELERLADQLEAELRKQRD